MKKLIVWITLAAVIGLSACSGGATNIPQTGGTTTVPTTIVATQATQPAQATMVSVSTTVPAEATSSPTHAATPANTEPAATASAIACTSPAPPTVALTEGPYWKANSPERTSLLDANLTGTKLTLTGYVLTTDCKPVAHALLDFWQANAQGQYDNSGYTLRGHQYTDANGRYTLETIIPGLYPGRTEHIHVKVQAPNGPVLTTQLFFPGVSQNQSDGIYDPSLLLPLQPSGDAQTATYNFIVNGQ